MIYKTKFYIVDLDTRRVDMSRAYRTFSEATDAERARGLTRRYTALRGSHILQNLHVWIVGEETK